MRAPRILADAAYWAREWTARRATTREAVAEIRRLGAAVDALDAHERAALIATLPREVLRG